MKDVSTIESLFYLGTDMGQLIFSLSVALLVFGILVVP